MEALLVGAIVASLGGAVASAVAAVLERLKSRQSQTGAVVEKPDELTVVLLDSKGNVIIKNAVEDSAQNRTEIQQEIKELSEHQQTSNDNTP